MSDNSKIFVLIGAGFSKLAGLPLANEISNFFIRDNCNKLLMFGSGESKWTDFANDVELNNGRLGRNEIEYGFILNALVGKFFEDKKSFTNYEDFYQFIIDNRN